MWISVNPGAYTYMEDGMASNTTYAELAERTNVQFAWTEVTPEMASENFNISMASQEYLDLYVDGPTQYSAGKDHAVEEGIFVDISGMIETWCPNLYDLLQASEADRKACYTDSGYLVGFPQFYNVPRPLDNGPVTHQEWLDALGMEAPSTYEEYHDYLTAIKTEYDAYFLPYCTGVPINGYLTSGYGVLGAVLTSPSFSMPFYQEDGQVKFGPIEEGFREYLTMMNTWYNEGLIYPDFVNETNPFAPTEELVTTGRAGVFYTDQWNLSMYDSMIGGDAEIVAIPDAVQNEGDARHFGKEELTVNTVFWAMSTACEEQELVCQLFNYMYSEEGSLLFNYGIEGLTYTVEDGEIVWTELISNNPEGMSMDNAIYAYVATNAPFVLNTQRSYSNYTENEVASVDIWNANTDSANTLPANIVMTTEESEEYNSLVTDIATYLQENIVNFIIGGRSLDEFDDFVAQIEEMGIQQCIDIYQAAYERYLER